MSVASFTCASSAPPGAQHSARDTVAICLSSFVECYRDSHRLARIEYENGRGSMARKGRKEWLRTYEDLREYTYS
jgi:hypothetical protein